MDAITTALLQKYGGMMKTPMLLNLAGANPGAVVQPNNPQPNLPGAAPMPQVQNRAPNHYAQTLMDEMMRKAGQGGQDQSAPPSLDLSGLGSAFGHIGNALGLNPTYTGTDAPMMEGLFGNAAGYGGMFGKAAPTLSAYSPANISGAAMPQVMNLPFPLPGMSPYGF